jgi:drug/metabolite transporter (DMT)-like permease
MDPSLVEAVGGYSGFSVKPPEAESIEHSVIESLRAFEIKDAERNMIDDLRQLPPPSPRSEPFRSADFLWIPPSISAKARAGGHDRVAFAILLTGLANGGALALYSASMLLTEVVRTLVLFYLAPMWGALLGILLLGERLTAARVAAIGLCLAGMLAILGVDHGWPWPTNIGDWLAILSGLVYAYGSLRVYDAPQVSVTAQTFSTMIGSVIVSAIVLLLLPDAARGAPPPASAALWLMAAIYAVAMILPINWVALWSAQHLTPARVGLIFALEAVVGIVSAALLLDEPFGWREALGSVLVIASTIVEVAGHRRHRGQAWFPWPG